MQIFKFPVVVGAALLCLAGCAGETKSPNTPSESSHNSTGSSPSAAAPERQKSTQAKKTKDPEPDKVDSSHKTKKTQKLVLSTSNEKITIRPTDVYCSGTTGHIHHIIGKTHNAPPLVKAEGRHFAMVKIGHGAPYKNTHPTGITYGSKSVTFNKLPMGSATLSGTMTCTTWND